MSYLSDSTYGKDNVKFLKVKKDSKNPKLQQIMECSCKVLLRGNFDIAYTKADNSPVVPTDTVKNTILVEAKKFDIWPIERFAIHLSNHFLSKYNHVSGVDVEIKQFKWSKYKLADGKYHEHSFVKDGEDFKQVDLSHDRDGKFTLKSGLKNLTVLKSTGSMFYGYPKCDYTTLEPTTDRILSTDVDLSYEFDSKKHSLKELFSKNASFYDTIYSNALQTTLKLFALENSPSVQATMYNMASEILAENKELIRCSYSLPNKHYFLIDFKWKGMDNKNELFYPSPHPNGLIKCTLERNKAKL